LSEEQIQKEVKGKPLSVKIHIVSMNQMFEEGISALEPSAKDLINEFVKNPSYHILQEKIRLNLKTSSMNWVQDFISHGGLIALTSILSKTNLLGK
jgi:hypothetical protein